MDQETSTTQRKETIPVWKWMLENEKRLKELMKKRNIDYSNRSESSLTIVDSKVDHVAKESPSKWLENGLKETIPVWKEMLEHNRRLKELMKKRNIDYSNRSESSLTIVDSKVDHVAKESPSEWLENGLKEKISMSRQ